MPYYPKRDDPEITVPRPCPAHKAYGGKKAPTSECRVCEMFYLERQKAVAHIKALLRTLDRYGVVGIGENQRMVLQTPTWMSTGRVRLKDDSPHRRRHCDGYLRHDRLRY
jgi:hypothetical protein